jgi:predicted RNase H-like HicB family nuclease
MPIITFNVEYEQEEDGRWLAELHELPGVLVNGQTSEEAIVKALALAPRVLADKLKHTTKHL